MAKKKQTNRDFHQAVPRTTQAIEIPIFGAVCEIIEGETVLAQAQSTLVQALGTRAMSPVSTREAIIMSQKELFTAVQWGETQTRQPRFDQLVQHFNDDMRRVRTQSSSGLQLGRLHVVKHPHADPRQAAAGASRQFLATQLYPAGDGQESPALRMRTIARNLLDGASHGHQASPTIEEITQPFVVLGEYFGGAQINTATNRMLQGELRLLGTITVGPLVIAEGFNLDAFAPPAS